MIAQQIGPGGKGLSQFDECRPEGFKSFGQPLPRPQSFDFTRSENRYQAGDEYNAGSDIQPLKQNQGIVAGKRSGDAQKTQDIADGQIIPPGLSR